MVIATAESLVGETVRLRTEDPDSHILADRFQEAGMDPNKPFRITADFPGDANTPRSVMLEQDGKRLNRSFSTRNLEVVTP